MPLKHYIVKFRNVLKNNITAVMFDINQKSCHCNIVDFYLSFLYKHKIPLIMINQADRVITVKFPVQLSA